MLKPVEHVVAPEIAALRPCGHRAAGCRREGRFQLQDEIVKIGIPFDTDEDDDIEAGWNVKLDEYYTEPGVRSFYEYDFGDCWQREVLLEKVLRREANVNYPRCVAGKKACPPEDCGGPGGYADLRRILRNPKDEEYQVK